MPAVSGSSNWNFLIYKIQNPSSNLKDDMFDGHIIHFLLIKLNVHAAIPGVTAEYTLLLRKLIHFFYCFYIEEHMVD